MAVLNDNKAIIAFKNLLNKSQTDSGKELGNEAEGIFFNVPGSAIWLDTIDPTPANAIAQGVAVAVTADMVLDGTSNGHGFFAEWPASAPAGTDPTTALSYAYGAGLLTGISAGDRVRNSIFPGFGFNYEAKPYDGANLIPPGDARDWVFQYNSGIFWQQDNAESALGVPTTIQLYVYTGSTLAGGISGGGGGSSEWLDSVASIQTANPGSPNIGDRYLVADSAATGLFTGQENNIAEWNGTNWDFIVPTDGTTVRVDNIDNTLYKWEEDISPAMWVQEPITNVLAGLGTGINTYNTTLNPIYNNYDTGTVLLMSFDNNNTGASTLNANGIGALPILKSQTGSPSLVPLVANDIQSGNVYTVVYDGVQWQINLGGGGTIGPAEDGTYTDGLWTDFTAATPIGTPIDRFNELFKSLVPPPAPDLSDWSVNAFAGDVNGKLSFDSANDIAGDTGYIGANIAGSSPSVSVDGQWTINTSTSNRLGIIASNGGDITGTLNDQVTAGPGTPNAAYPADSFNQGTTGSIKMYVNGTLVSTADLTSTDLAIDTTTGGTTSGVNLSAKAFGNFPLGDPFTFSIYRTGTWRLTDDDANLVKGYNYVVVEHDLGTSQLTLDRYDFIIDTNTVSTAYSGDTFDNLQMNGSSTKFISGIEYFTEGDADYDIVIDNAYRNTYISGNAISYIGGNCTAIAEPLPPNGGNELQTVTITDKDVNINGNIRLLHPSGTGDITIRTQVLRTLQGTTQSTIQTISNILLDSRTPVATEVGSEDFVGEAYRLINANGGLNYDLLTDIANNPWDSTEVLKDTGTAGYLNGLQVYNDKLVLPTLDFSFANAPEGTSNPNAGDSTRDYSSGVTGNRVYTRYFKETGFTVGNFVMNIAGSGGTFVPVTDTVTSNWIHVEIKGPTQTGWMDAYANFATAQWLDGDGARNDSAGAGRAFNTNWGLTIGTKSTANTGGNMVVRITVGASFTGEFTGITWSFG